VSATTYPDLVLRRANQDDEEEFLRVHRATSPEVQTFLHHYTEGMSFRRYLEMLEEHERGVNLPSPGHVPSTFLFAFVAARIVGRASIRHSLNAFFERVGGHVGYVVVPEFRRRGHATTILRLALEIAHDRLGIGRVLVTCDDDNIGSIKTIEKMRWRAGEHRRRTGSSGAEAALLGRHGSSVTMPRSRRPESLEQEARRP
jgi:predicted acetyltransferase